MPTTSVTTVADDRNSIDKAFSILVAFGDQPDDAVSLSELARRSNLNKSTAFRLLATLERNAVVERVGVKYRLGTRLHDLGRRSDSTAPELVRDALLPFLAEMFEMSRHTVNLAVLQCTEVVYLAKLYGHRNIATPSRIGGRLPAHCTAVGKVLLAYDPVAEAAALAGPLPRLTAHSIDDPRRLAAELDRIRRDGVAIDDQESRAGLTCVAAPIRGPHGRPVAAMSVSAPLGADRRALTAMLRQVCASASRALLRAPLTRSA